jgi:hypothetical protein
VDKTALVYQMANTNQIYFLSRPRRFGKSLLLSTLKAYFEGKKHLFEGLVIETWEKEWTAYPVLHISFARTRYDKVDNLKELLNIQLSEWEKLYGSNVEGKGFGVRFDGIIKRAYAQTGKEVVVLIDEYDSPMLDSSGNEALQRELRNIIREFFSPLKDNTERLRFLFITGITKFSQMSIFSELNSLNNISMDYAYSTICGITEEELHNEFKTDIEALAEENEETYEEACAHLKRMYDGYHFSARSKGVYNPFSIINVLSKRIYDSYWYGTGTPTFLVELLRKEQQMSLEDLESNDVTAQSFDRSTDTLTDPLPVLYQSGYLTIKGYRQNIYTLGYPNDEVKYGFLNSLLPSFVGRSRMESEISLIAMKKSLDVGDIEACMTRFRSFVASIPYEQKSDKESRFEVIFYILFTLMGQFVQTQRMVSSGRADVVITNENYVYVFELKVGATPDEALAQIEDKGYGVSYDADSRKVVKVGVSYDKETHNITEWKVR